MKGYEGLGLGLGVRPLCPWGHHLLHGGGAWRKEATGTFHKELSEEETGLR